MWPTTLPDPQAEGFTIASPPRVELAEVLFGPTRMAVKARTAPMAWTFSVVMTPEQMEIFEGWYTDLVENHDGEFYARWIGGSRVVAFSQAYEYRPLGRGYILSGNVFRTRIDHSVCDAYLSTVFTAIYRAELGAVDHYVASLGAVDRYVGDWPLTLIASSEC